MDTKIELINNTTNGDIKLEAFYKEENIHPSYIVIKDHRTDSSRRLRFRYEKSSNQLGLISINKINSDAELDDVVDHEVRILIEEVYPESVEISTLGSHMFKLTKNKVRSIIGGVGSKIRDGSSDIFGRD